MEEFGMQGTMEMFGMLHLELKDGGNVMSMLGLMLYMVLTMYWLLHFHHLYMVRYVIRQYRP